MRKNYKLVLGLVAGLTIGSAVGLTAQPTTTEAKIKYETPKQAGQRWYKAQTEAYKGKKKVTKVFYIKAKNESQVADVTYRMRIAAVKAQYKGQYSETWGEAGASADYRKTSYKKVKKGVYRWQITYNGKNKKFRKEYREAEYNREMLTELTSLTKGKSQFDRAWITMQWFQGRSIYQCGNHQDWSVTALYKRKFHAACGPLAWTYEDYAKAAGVKKVGMVSTKDHSFNYIVVNGRMYFIDYQSCSNAGFGRKGDLSGKEFVEKMYDPEYVTKEWDFLNSWDKIYRKYVDDDAEKELTCKAIYNKMTKEQRKAAGVNSLEGFDLDARYALECDSWSQFQFLPMKVYCSKYSDYTVKKIKKIVPKKLHKYLW